MGDDLRRWLRAAMVAAVVVTAGGAIAGQSDTPATGAGTATAVATTDAPATTAAAATDAAAQGRKATWDHVERIVAVGDVHGDYGQLVKVLQAAEVIDKDNQWIGGKTHLVQTGDVFDRGPDSRKAMDLLMSLEQQAAKAGGAVHALVGNHEAMILAGHWAYLTEEEVKSFGDEDGFRKAMSAEGKYGKWIRGHDAVIRINDVLFLHAGLRAEWASAPLEGINEAVRKELAEGKMGEVTSAPEGPLWDRMYSTDEGPDAAEELDEVFRKYGAAHMVIGHTVMRRGVTERSDGRVICIDVGLSGIYGGPAACLLIEKGVFYELTAGKGKRKLDVAAPAKSPAPAGTAAPATDGQVEPKATPKPELLPVPSGALPARREAARRAA